MSKTLSLTPRAQTLDKKNATKRTPVRGHNRNNHALKAKVTTSASTENRESKFKSDQSKQSSVPFSKSEHLSKKRSDRFTAKTASNDVSAKPTGRPSNKPSYKSAGKASQTVLRHGKMRDGVREFADGRVVPSKRRDRNADDLMKKHDSNNPKQKILRHEAGVVRKTQNTQTTQSTEHSNVKSSKFNRAPLPESAASGIRISKYLADQGLCSRREADEFIQAGVVKVNGEVVTELGTKITRADEVMFHDQPVSLESKVYVLLNKPKGFVTTTDDPENRKTVMDLVKAACKERIYPVGRLDRATTGVLLLTNDGDLASKLTHPKYEKRKIYQVWLDKPVAMEHMQTVADGIELEDGEIHADAISYVTEDDLSQVGIEIHSGKNRVVRRIFEKLGYRVIKLDRVYFAGLTKKNLSRGKWRYLSEKEVNMLRMGAFD